MKKSEALPLLDAVAEVVKQYVDEKIAEVPAGKEGPAGAPGEPGRDADPEVVRSMVEAEFQARATEMAEAFVKGLNDDVRVG